MEILFSFFRRECPSLKPYKKAGHINEQNLATIHKQQPFL